MLSKYDQSYELILEEFKNFLEKKLNIDPDFTFKMFGVKKIRDEIDQIFLEKFNHKSIFEFILDFYVKNDKVAEVIVFFFSIQQPEVLSDAKLDLFLQILNFNDQEQAQFFTLNNTYLDLFQRKKKLNQNEKFYFLSYLKENDAITIAQEKKGQQNKFLNKLQFLISIVRLQEDQNLNQSLYNLVRSQLHAFTNFLLHFQYNRQNDQMLQKIVLQHVDVFWKIIFYNNKRLWKRFLGINSLKDLENFQNQMVDLDFSEQEKITQFVKGILKQENFFNLLEQLVIFYQSNQLQ